MCIRDRFFGTFREKLGESSEYSGAAEDANTKDDFAKPSKDGTDPAAKGPKRRPRGAKVWSRSGYLGVPESKTHAVYSLLVTPALAAFAVHVALASPASPSKARANALIVATAPVVAALLLCALSKDALSWRWPFHRERGAFLFFNALATLCCGYPVYEATRLVALT